MRFLVLLFLTLALSPSLSRAQPKGLDPIPPTPMPPIIKNFPGLSPEQVQKIMDHAMKVQQCLATEGKEPLRRLQRQNAANSKKVQALCEAGKKQEAQELAVQQAQELAGSDDMKVMEKCRGDAETLAKELPDAVPPQAPSTDVPENICDMGLGEPAK